MPSARHMWIAAAGNLAAEPEVQCRGSVTFSRRGKSLLDWGMGPEIGNKSCQAPIDSHADTCWFIARLRCLKLASQRWWHPDGGSLLIHLPCWPCRDSDAVQPWNQRLLHHIDAQRLLFTHTPCLQCAHRQRRLPWCRALASRRPCRLRAPTAQRGCPPDEGIAACLLRTKGEHEPRIKGSIGGRPLSQPDSQRPPQRRR